METIEEYLINFKKFLFHLNFSIIIFFFFCKYLHNHYILVSDVDQK